MKIYIFIALIFIVIFISGCIQKLDIQNNNPINKTSKLIEVPIIPLGSKTSTLIEVPKTPLGSKVGHKFLKDDKCLTSLDADVYKWGIFEASRKFLIQKGYTRAYFDQHFCPIAINYEYNLNPEYGYALVTYKSTFDPYLAWWQHHFPVVIDNNKQPKIQDSMAIIDTSGKTVFVPEFEISEINTLLSPEKLYNTMKALIGTFDGPLAVYMGPAIGKKQVRLYARAVNKNPNSSNCSDTERIGVIDIETGKGEITFSGSCP